MTIARSLAMAVAFAVALSSAACGGSPPRAVPVAHAPRTQEPSEPVRRYRILSEASSVTAVASAALGSYTLEIAHVEGHIDWVPRQPNRSRFVFEADMRTVSGSVDAVTRIVRNQFLHVERHPRAGFRSEIFRDHGQGRGSVTGILDLHGVSRRIRVPGQFRFEGQRLHLTSEFVIDRRSHGIESSGMLDSVVHDDVEVRLSLVAERESGPGTDPMR